VHPVNRVPPPANPMGTGRPQLAHSARNQTNAGPSVPNRQQTVHSVTNHLRTDRPLKGQRLAGPMVPSQAHAEPSRQNLHGKSRKPSSGRPISALPPDPNPLAPLRPAASPMKTWTWDPGSLPASSSSQSSIQIGRAQTVPVAPAPRSQALLTPVPTALPLAVPPKAAPMRAAQLQPVLSAAAKVVSRVPLPPAAANPAPAVHAPTINPVHRRAGHRPRGGNPENRPLDPAVTTVRPQAPALAHQAHLAPSLRAKRARPISAPHRPVPIPTPLLAPKEKPAPAGNPSPVTAALPNPDSAHIPSPNPADSLSPGPPQTGLRLRGGNPALKANPPVPSAAANPAARSAASSTDAVI